jgi:hypothetical protein
MYSNSDGSLIANGVKLALCLGLEFLLFVLHYAVYVQTIETLPLELYLALVDLPVVGSLFSWDPEITLTHLLSVVFAAASVSMPVLLWYHIIKDSVFEQLGAYLAGVTAKVVAGAVFGIYSSLVALEFFMLYTRMQMQTTSPLAGAQLIDNLPSGTAFAVFVSGIFILVNAAVALFTASIYVELNHQLRRQSYVP